MFTPHQSVHQFSPQRRQILGTGKRAGQKKTFLGEEEANNVGPQKLFSDLKHTAGKSAGTSNVFSKSPSRALGDKNTQSPQRSQDGPSKPSLVRIASKDVTTGNTLLEVSPDKQKQRARSPSKSPSKATRQISPARNMLAPMSSTPLLSSKDLDEGTSYHTTTTPFNHPPKTPPADHEVQRSLQRQSSFVTPASNIGEAGAMRLRKGELYDALNQVEEEGQVQGQLETESKEALEEEAYPEIEYMPPSVEVPYDFPPQLDGLPRAKELGESMAKMSVTGFYQPSSEKENQEMLADVFKFRPRKVEIPVMPPLELKEDDEPWPDVEVRLPTKKQTINSKSSTTIQKTSSLKKLGSHPVTSSVRSVKGSVHMKPLTSSAKPRALSERDNNATNKKKVMNPALRDFDDDQMGKIIKAKLQASESQEPQGFLL